MYHRSENSIEFLTLELECLIGLTSSSIKFCFETMSNTYLEPLRTTRNAIFKLQNALPFVVGGSLITHQGQKLSPQNCLLSSYNKASTAEQQHMFPQHPATLWAVACWSGGWTADRGRHPSLKVWSYISCPGHKIRWNFLLAGTSMVLLEADTGDSWLALGGWPAPVHSQAGTRSIPCSCTPAALHQKNLKLKAREYKALL